MNPPISSNFYLERVGFEAKVNLRHNLNNNGQTLIGRVDTQGVDIRINSFLCSRNHCVISVLDDAVSIEDLNSSNGTTINGVKTSGKHIIKENDLIGIVGGSNQNVSDLKGNWTFFVYRLCKYTSDNIQTFEIEDDDPIELSDDEDNVICLDSDGESVDIKEEYDLDIQLSRNFNTEIKKELEDMDENWDSTCMAMKTERIDEQFNETDDNFNEVNYNQINESPNDENETTINAHPEVSGHYNPLINDDTMNDSDSNAHPDVSAHHSPLINGDAMNDSDSNETVCFPASGSGSGSDEESNNKGNVLPDNCDSAAAAPLSDQTNSSKTRVSLQSLQETISKISSAREKKMKRSTEMINPKPFKKRRRSRSEESTCNVKLSPKTEKDKKEKLKALASTPPKAPEPVDDKLTAQTTPKVKFTPHNRGHFLTDERQIPALPKDVQQKHKGSSKLNDKVRLSPEKVVSPKNSPIHTPPELEQKIWKDMHSYGTPLDPILPPNVQKSNKKPVIQILDMQIIKPIDEDSGTCDSDSFSHQDDEMVNNFVESDDGVEMDTQENENEGGNDDEDDDDDDDDDSEINLLNIIMKLPPETGSVHIIETKPKPKNLKSILKSSQTKQQTIVGIRRVTFKESGFQFNPRHKFISDITAYNDAEFETVDAFCRSINTNIRSFADSYDDYHEYRSTLVSLMMIELWKEIELEYINSKIHDFTVVTINDKNLEKRGDGQRMVFHCQADALYRSQNISDGHLVFAMCEHNGKETEFLALITSIAYSNKNVNQKLAYFTMETSALTEILPIQSLRIRPITVITNTLNSFNAIYDLKYSPLKNLITNPLSEEIPSTSHIAENLTFKTYDTLDMTQRRILNNLYRRCINLTVPNVSLLNGAAGTGKSCMIVNLALQLVYGDGLPKPLRILICSKTNGSINDLTKKLISIRDNTSAITTKIQLVRFGMLENMDSVVRRVSVQSLKESEQHYSQFTNYEELENQKRTLGLKITAYNLDNERDHSTALKVLEKQLYKVNALMDRFEGMDKMRRRDTTTFILNSCDIICTTLACIPKLQKYVSQVDVCIIDEATQCNEPLTLLPFQFGMPSLILVGDSQLVPLSAYSPIVKEMNYGNSLFARLQKLYLGKCGSPVFEMNFQYRLHQEILMWPNQQFYKNCLVPHDMTKNDNFPIAPYKIISYGSDRSKKESDNIRLVLKVLLGHVDWQANSFGMICTNFKQNSKLKNELRDYPYITTNTADSYMGEKDVVIIWISEEHGLSHLAHQQTLNAAVTRARKCLLILGANLTSYKNRPVWRSLLENANSRKCMQHFKVLTAPKICNTLNKNNLRNQCDLCRM